MIEKAYPLARGDEKIIEKVLMDENLHYLHMVLPEGEGLPEHTTNGNVYMTVLRGRLTLTLGEQEAHEYEAGTLLTIPIDTRMNARNGAQDTLEILVVKAPAPIS